MAPFAATESGISGLQTLLPLAFDALREHSLPPSAIVDRLTVGPAAIIGLEMPRLGIGSRADIVVFDPDAEQRVSSDHWFSGGMNNPYLGQTLMGKVEATFFEGRQVYSSVPIAE
jgi:dihydroorotase